MAIIDPKYTRFPFLVLPYSMKHLAVPKELMMDYNSGIMYLRSTDGVTDIQLTDPNMIGHITDINNPHQVTKEQIGLGNVENYTIGTIEDIKNGVSNKYITADILKQYLDDYVVTNPTYTLTINPTPIDAIVELYINNQWVVGTSHSNLLPGTYTYRVSKDGYATNTGTATIVDADVILNIELLESIFTLTINPTPIDALVEVYINNQWVTGNSHTNLSPGNYEYRVSKDGYESSTGTATIVDTDITLDITLSEIYVFTKLVSDIYYNGAAFRDNGTVWVWGRNDNLQLSQDLSSFDSNIPLQLPDTDWIDICYGYRYCIGLKQDGTLWGVGYEPSLVSDPTYPFNFLGSFVKIGTDNDWSKVFSAGTSVFVIKQNGTLWGFGNNNEHQVSFTNSDTYIPNLTQIGTDSDWNIISGHNKHIIGLKQDGTLWGWGYDSFNELGIPGMIIDQITQIGIDTDWAEISTGIYHTLAIKTDGTLWATGYNVSGQLGLGDNTDRSTFTQVGTDTDWKQVSCGEYHTIAIKNDGTLWSTGDNDYGQLGLGDNTNRSIFTQVGTDTDWIDISCRDDHTIALKSNGTLWATGLNNDGQLGLGDNVNRNTFTQIIL